jgi:hypothetical protein
MQFPIQRKNIVDIYYLIIDSYPVFICEQAFSQYQTESRHPLPHSGPGTFGAGTILVKKGDNTGKMRVDAHFMVTFEHSMQTGHVRHALTYSSVHE